MNRSEQNLQSAITASGSTRRPADPDAISPEIYHCPKCGREILCDPENLIYLTHRGACPVCKPERLNKFGAKKITVDGITFDSIREAKRYGDLKLLQAGGQIQELELQPRFEIQILSEHFPFNHPICAYVADFRYFDVSARKTIVEDAKGYRNRLYRLKLKLARAVLGLEILET
jgi:DNA-directed RNA polymerase subunit RPC12/RpoP